MKKQGWFGIVAIVAMLFGFFFVNPVQVNARDRIILEFNTMAGLPKAYVGTNAPIRGINGGGLPWVISAAQGELSANGRLELHVVGLVFNPNDPDVIAKGLANMNTVPNFRAIVSCQSVDQTGTANVVNVMTDPFPARVGSVTSGGGNAKIETKVALPHPCIAPIVFVTSPTGVWFASTGN